MLSIAIRKISDTDFILFYNIQCFTNVLSTIANFTVTTYSYEFGSNSKLVCLCVVYDNKKETTHTLLC